MEMKLKSYAEDFYLLQIENYALKSKLKKK